MKRIMHPILAAGILAWGLSGLAAAQSTPVGGPTTEPGVVGVDGSTSGTPVLVPPVYYQSVFGTVDKVGASDIEIRTGDPLAAGPSIDVQVTKDTRFIREQNVDIDQLAPGDPMSVNGRPKGIIAESAQSGDNVYVPGPAPLPPQKPGDGSLPPAPVKQYVSASAYAAGVVTSVDKTSRIVLLTLNDGSTLSVDVPAGVKVHQSKMIDLSGVKVGDTIFASGFVPFPQPAPAPGAGGSGKMGDPGTSGDPINPGGVPSPPGMTIPEGPFTATYVNVGDIGEVGIYAGTTVSGGVGVVSGGVVTGGVATGGTVSGGVATGGGVSVPPTPASGGPTAPIPPAIGDNGGAVTHGLRGSLTGSGRVGIADATLALRIAVGAVKPTAAQLAAGDLFNEGRITLKDVTLILRAVVFGLSI